jgi:hypothetical protein
MRAIGRRPFPVLLCILLSPLFARPTQTEPASAQELVRGAVANELKQSSTDKKFMFQQLKRSPSGSQTSLMVQTRDAMAGLVVAYNDNPLSEEQRKGELARVQRFTDSPDELKKKQKQEKDNEDRVARIIRAMPDAFLYERDGAEAGTTGVGKAGESLERLKFRPNPNYDPPSRVEQILTGMQGYVLVDARQNRIAKIDGTLQKDVSFGWGILGHLDKGGRFEIEQGDIGEGQWRITHMDAAFTGKILIFKSLAYKVTEIYSDFHLVAGDLSFAQGLEVLKKHEAEWLVSRNKP